MSSFEEKELAILRAAVDRAEEKAGKQLTNSDEVQKIIQIVHPKSPISSDRYLAKTTQAS